MSFELTKHLLDYAAQNSERSDADERLHDAVSADNVRRMLAGTLTDPMPGTLAAEVEERVGTIATAAFDAGFKAGLS